MPSISVRRLFNDNVNKLDLVWVAGTPPDAEQIPIDRRPVTITKDPRWAANAGACTRGAIQLTSGVSINLWQPFCDFFALIRGVVVGMFGLAGAFIFRNGVK